MKATTVFMILIFIINVQGQFNSQVPDLIIPITITYDIPPYPFPYVGDSLLVGIDSVATDSVDEIFGEIELPPIPPPGWPSFLILPTNDFIIVHRDFRNGEYPYNGIKEHQLRFCSLCGATISWVLPENVTGSLQDLFGGIIINVNLSGSGNYYVSDTDIFKLKLNIYYNQATPVELTSFISNILDNAVTLSWTTATETNNQGFQIERRKTQDERSDEWENIGFINGKGTTSEPQSYSFVDENLQAGKYQYRLKQIDFDGTFEYSNTIEVETNSPTKFSLEQNYPNPFNPSTKISWQSPVGSWQTLKVYDILGNEIATLVNEEKSAGQYEVEFNPESSIKNPASGIYFYQLRAGDYIQTKKMVLMR